MSNQVFNYNNYIFFWGVKQKVLPLANVEQDTNKDYGYFSNFYPCTFTEGNKIFNCSEQYFMKKKQELFDKTNEVLANKIMNETNPMVIKKYGRSVDNYNEMVWNQNRYSVMKQALLLKFSDPQLKSKLLETGNKILVEASPYDPIWGIGLDESAARKVTPSQWKGTNLLGKALMEVRDIFRNQE